MNFQLVSDFKPAGDQKAAISHLNKEILYHNTKNQVLLGATGSGKTFTMANVIQKLNRQVLIIAHNKTLAMQLYVELKNFFPHNRVEYFVSNFDFFQPEAYLPSRDLYIDKDVKHNLQLDMMRLSATNALLTRKDTIVVASVACIFALQNPNEYEKAFFEIKLNEVISKNKLLTFLIKSGYQRTTGVIESGEFSANGDVIKIAPGHSDNSYIRLDLLDDKISEVVLLDQLNHTVKSSLRNITIFPAQSYVTNRERLTEAIKRIKLELQETLLSFQNDPSPENKLKSYRLQQRTNYDLETLQEFGVCGGIENYSMHLDLRNADTPPYTLLDYFQNDFITIIDESHMTVPQIRAMFNTNLSRKKTLINYGFRLPSAMQNRPLNFDEFNARIKTTIFTSATPADYELNLVNQKVTEQIIRPTGLLDPVVEVMQPEMQMDYILKSIHEKAQVNEKVLITTLTKRMSEDVTTYLQEHGCKATYLHSELKTLERSVIINDLRRGVYDALVGVNLLREGIDIPEISLICILDANKQGFLRDTRSLIQTIGRAARNKNGRVVMFAHSISPSMERAIDETNRRRNKQIAFNTKHNIVPQTISKKIEQEATSNILSRRIKNLSKQSGKNRKQAKEILIKDLTVRMHKASKELDFGTAANMRDLIISLQ